MINIEQNVVNGMVISPVRATKASVELYEGSTLVETCKCNDRLIKFTIERVGEGKFFGFGICQKINVHLIDKERTLNITTAHSIKVGIDCSPWQDTVLYPYPTFYVSEVRRDENTNELSITGYDLLYPETAHTINEMVLPESYTLYDFVLAAGTALGVSDYKFINNTDTNDAFALIMPKGGNFEGTETIREGLNDVAEITQTIFYIDRMDRLVFRRLAKDAEPDWIIDKSNYFTLQSKTNRRLGVLYHTTALGDNLHVETAAAGSTQYIRDNGFWTAFQSTEIAVELEKALARVGGMTINQFDCYWRGNFLLEIGDKLGLVTKDNETVHSYLLDDIVTFNGSFSETTLWQFTVEEEAEGNPTTIGDKLNQTFARVDKVNQEVEIVAGETASIKLTNDAIQSSVQKLDNNLSEVMAEVNTKVSAEDLTISIKEAMSEQGMNAITTTTGFTFNEQGLHIEKTNSDMTTSITEDGMKIYRRGNEILVADNLGVRAEDLHATTFLIIGDNSRLENYEGTRTGCFFIGRA